MISIKNCPECGTYLTRLQCKCGWVDVKNKQEPVSDSSCGYLVNNQRCPLPGTMSKALYGNAQWVCSKHWEIISLDQEKN